MSHVVVGAGPVGSPTARQLAESGHEVRIVTRSGSGPDHPGIERVAADVTERGTLGRLAAGADALYNCASPPYHRWLTDWPPLADAFLRAAEESGAVLVAATNVYGYGPVDHPMREDDPFRATTVKGPVRARMWTDMLAAHEAGRIRATEARASDFFGPGVTNSHLGDLTVAPVLRGKAARVIGDPDTLHSWTYVPDLARTLVTLATDERAWGRPWHVPTNPATGQRAVLRAIARAAGAPEPRLKPTPRWALRAAGVVSPELREVVELTYQFERDFVLDSSAFTAEFGAGPTPLDDAVAATAAWWVDHLRAAA
jgi:nucleoside-diphosphate-sugar epimerase